MEIEFILTHSFTSKLFVISYPTFYYFYKNEIYGKNRCEGTD